eukprot:8550798-Ditylum_brightwellii.AAC.2
MGATLTLSAIRIICITVVSLKKTSISPRHSRNKGTAEQWTRPWQKEKLPSMKFDCPKFKDIDNPGGWSELSY